MSYSVELCVLYHFVQNLIDFESFKSDFQWNKKGKSYADMDFSFYLLNLKLFICSGSLVLISWCVFFGWLLKWMNSLFFLFLFFRCIFGMIVRFFTIYITRCLAISHVWCHFKVGTSIKIRYSYSCKSKLINFTSHDRIHTPHTNNGRNRKAKRIKASKYLHACMQKMIWFFSPLKNLTKNETVRDEKEIKEYWMRW